MAAGGAERRQRRRRRNPRAAAAAPGPRASRHGPELTVEPLGCWSTAQGCGTAESSSSPALAIARSGWPARDQGCQWAAEREHAVSRCGQQQRSAPPPPLPLPCGLPLPPLALPPSAIFRRAQELVLLFID